MAYSARKVLNEKRYRKCRGKNAQDVAAFIHFAETYVKIQHPKRGSISFELRPAQREIIETWMQERNSIVLKARQIGWSTLVAVYCLWLAMFWDDRIIVMLSKNEREAQKLLAKSIYAYERLPEWMRNRGPKRTSNNVQKLSFANASVIESLPSKEDPARGAAVSLIVCDEWAFFENAENAWAAIEPVTDVGGRVIGLSTANGSGDFFEQFWVRATTGVSDFRPMFYPWSANTDRDEDWYATKKRNMLEWQLHQEYPTTPEEAFIKSGNAVFDVDALAEMLTTEPKRGHLETFESIKAPVFRASADGELRIWAMPQPLDGYVIGGDVAEGLEHGDFSSATILSVNTGKKVATWHGHTDSDLFGEILAALGYFYNTALIGCEVNNHGLVTCKQLQRLDYPRIYWRRQIDARTDKQSVKIGWYTSSTSKPLMIGELVMALRVDDDGRADVVTQDAETIAELRTYKRDEKGRMGGSPFDDRVMSLAIANQMRRYHRASVQEDKVEQHPWSIESLITKAKRAGATEQEFLGQHNVRQAA